MDWSQGMHIFFMTLLCDEESNDMSELTVVLNIKYKSLFNFIWHACGLTFSGLHLQMLVIKRKKKQNHANTKIYATKFFIIRW